MELLPGPGGASPTAGSATPTEAVGPYLRAVRRRWPLVILITLVAAGVAGYTATKAGSTYTASASVLVEPLPESDPTWVGTGVVMDTGDPARVVQTAAALIDSNQAAAAAVRTLGSGWTTDSVQKAVSVTPLGQSDVVSVSASASSPRTAARLANVFTDAAVAARGAVVQQNIANQIAQAERRIAALPATSPELGTLTTTVGELRQARATGGDPSLQVSQTAQPPTTPSGASKKLIILLALLGGFALASVAAVGLEFFSTPVRDEDELEHLFPGPVLASIPAIRRHSDAPLSPSAFPPVAFEQVRMLRVQLEVALKARVIMVTSASAGDGKTTLVAALAAAFAETGQSVILIDLDLRKPSLASFLKVDPGLWTRRRGNTSLVLKPVPNLPNVRLMPISAESFEALDEMMARLPLMIEEAREAASVVIVDTAPAGEVSDALSIAPMCETVVFVARARKTPRRRLALAHDLLTRTGASIAGLVVIGSRLPTGGYDGYYRYSMELHEGIPDPPAPTGSLADRIESVTKPAHDV